MVGKYWVTPITLERKAEFVKMFGSETVEVTTPFPFEASGALDKPYFLLKLESLSEEQFERMVAHVVAKFGLEAEYVRASALEGGVPILAEKTVMTTDANLDAFVDDVGEMREDDLDGMLWDFFDGFFDDEMGLG